MEIVESDSYDISHWKELQKCQQTAEDVAAKPPSLSVTSKSNPNVTVYRQTPADIWIPMHLGK